MPPGAASTASLRCQRDTRPLPGSQRVTVPWQPIHTLRSTISRATYGSRSPQTRSSRCSSRAECGSSQSSTPPVPTSHSRSEEHTSELQSRENLVCRLLLEKKKIHRNHEHIIIEYTS